MRLAEVFARAREDRRAAFVAYLTFGDPDPATSIEIMEQVCRRGCDVLEIGVPYSDPSADGPSIQRAMERALDTGAGLVGALAAVATLRARGITTPVVLFGYYNPIFVMGVERFADAAKAAGVDAVLTVDLPLEELGELATPLAARGLGVIPLIAPTSTPARIARLGSFAPPFVYYVSVTGVTGDKPAALVSPERLAAIRSAAHAPVAVGFGIRTPADVARFAGLADGIVVGTALVDAVAKSAPAAAPGAVAALVEALAAACRYGNV